MPWWNKRISINYVVPNSHVLLLQVVGPTTSDVG